MRYGIKIISGKTAYGRRQPHFIGYWAHQEHHRAGFSFSEWVFVDQDTAQQRLDQSIVDGNGINTFDFVWTVAPIPREECVRFRQERKGKK